MSLNICANDIRGIFFDDRLCHTVSHINKSYFGLSRGWQRNPVLQHSGAY